MKKGKPIWTSPIHTLTGFNQDPVCYPSISRTIMITLLGTEVPKPRTGMTCPSFSFTEQCLIELNSVHSSGYTNWFSLLKQICRRKKTAQFLFLTALMRYESRTIKSPLLNYTIQWLFVYSESCYHCSTLEHFHQPQRNFMLIRNSSPFLPPSRPWHYFLFLQIGLFWKFYVSTFIHYVAFCDCLFSLCINVFKIHPCCSICQYFIPFYG